MKKPIYKLNINQIIKLIRMFYYTKWCMDYDGCFEDDKHFKIWLKERINLVIKE